MADRTGSGIADLPALGGSYALLLRPLCGATIEVGRLGDWQPRRVPHVYLGSAWGPGGLRGRVGRHLRGAGRPHWHVDHLRRVAEVLAVLLMPGARRECAWARSLRAAGLRAPLAGFGASDCDCPAHLFELADGDVDGLATRLAGVPRAVGPFTVVGLGATGNAASFAAG